MMPNANLASWSIYLPSLLLAALIYLLLARLVLALILGPDQVLMRVVAAITDPVLIAVGAVTPRVVPAHLVIVCAAVWLLSARILLHQAAMVLGMRRMLG